MKPELRRLYILLVALALLVLAAPPAAAQGEAPLALVLNLDGPITPATYEYLARGVATAEQEGAEVLILRLNTPGGMIDSMSRMVQEMRNSSVPVVVYIAPRGSMAASAGAVITMAGHLAAMAPETTIGAASPVGMQGEDLSETMFNKETESLKATIRSVAGHRSPQAISLAEAIVDEARAVSSSEALEAGLIDLIANDLDDLLTQLDGRTVELESGTRTLHTAGAVSEELAMSLIEQILLVLTNPNVILILLGIGAQAIIIEISSPGGWVAGFIGVVCLVLGGYGLGVLTVNWFGLIFLVISFVLFILDIKAPTHGALTAAGVGSFIIGALVLFNSPGTPEFQRVSLPLVILVAILLGLTFAVILGFALRAMRIPLRAGRESIAGKRGTARTDIDPEGQVQVMSELWTARLAKGSPPVSKGERIEVVEIEGLKLKVRKAKQK